MTKNTLEKIIDNRIIEIENRKKLVPIERLMAHMNDYENIMGAYEIRDKEILKQMKKLKD